MKPSDRRRRRLMRLCSPRLLANGFRIGATIMLIFCIGMAAFTFRMSRQAATLALGMGLLFFVIFELVARAFVPWVMHLITKHQIDYLVADVDISKEELLQEASEMELPNELWYAEICGDWIDIGWDWQRAVSIAPGTGSKTVRLFKKMILIHDDHTFEELDMKYDASVTAGGGLTLGASKNVEYGHFWEKAVNVNFGVNLQNGNVGVNEYRLNTADVGNYIHGWLAERGYAER